MKLIREGNYVTTTVGGLIAELSKFDPDTPVFTEGCDCVGNVVSVSTHPDGTVLIERDDSAVKWSQDVAGFVVAECYRDRVSAA